MSREQNTVADAVKYAMRPPTNQTPWEWARDNVKISNSERSSSFDPEQTPWWKAPMECMADDDTREVVVIAPTGSGKSTMAEGLIPFLVAEQPGSMLYASQTDTDARFWAETRLTPALKSVEAIRDLWPEDRHKSRKLEIIFPHMSLLMGGANISNFQEKSVSYIYGDEVWKWTTGLLRECQARTHGRWNRKEYYVSQAGFAGAIDEDGKYVGGDDLWQEWMKTDRAEYSWKCECGCVQPFAFESLKYDIIHRSRNIIDEEATAKTARMGCRECPKEYADNAMIRRGLSDSGRYVATNPFAMETIRGFHVDSLAVWWLPWWQEVLEYLRAKRLSSNGFHDLMRQWEQKRRARFWSEDMVDSEIEITCGDYSIQDRKKDELIEDEYVRFATADVGKDHFWVIIAAWKMGGFCKVLYAGYVLSDGGNESQLKAIFNDYAVPRHRIVMDIGYNKDDIVGQLCKKNGWSAVKGDGTNRKSFSHQKNGKPVERLFSPNKRSNKYGMGMITYVEICTNEIKDRLYRMLASGDKIEFPIDAPSALADHMRAERRITERHKQTGAERVTWILPPGKANHLWDAMVYQVYCAIVMNIFGDLT
jgi:phage terminase large subunit GpA-like protein